MKIYAKVDFQAGERACVKNARPNHIGGQSPPFFACFDRICSLFRGFHREENHAQVCVKNRMNTNSGACNAKKPVFAGSLQASEAKKEAFMEDRQTRFSLHISEETLDTAKALSKSDGCKSVSEYTVPSSESSRKRGFPTSRFMACGIPTLPIRLPSAWMKRRWQRNSDTQNRASHLTVMRT